MLLCLFGIFILATLTLILLKTLWKTLWKIFKYLATRDSKMAACLLFSLKISLFSGYSHKIPGSIIQRFVTTIEKSRCIVFQK